MDTQLLDLIPYGQVGIALKEGLEAAIHATLYCLQQHGYNPDLYLLKLNMCSAFNECIVLFFLTRSKLVFLNLAVLSFF